MSTWPYEDDHAPNYTMTLDQVLAEGYSIFDFEYQLVDESTKQTFEEFFISRYRFREIGAETVDRFKHYLKDSVIRSADHWAKLLEAYATPLALLQTSKKTTTTTRSRTSEKAEQSAQGSVTDDTFTDQPDHLSEEILTPSSKRRTASDIDGSKNATDDENETIETVESSIDGVTEIELLATYYSKLRDVMDDYIATFENCFMLLF